MSLISNIRAGTLNVSLWRNEENGLMSAKLEKSYKKDDSWETTQYLNKNDLLACARLLQKTYDRILQVEDADRTARRMNEKWNKQLTQDFAGKKE